MAAAMVAAVAVLAAGCGGGPAAPASSRRAAASRPAAASSPSLARLRAHERRLTEASKPVEQAVTIIRSQLGLPPPETS